MIDPLYVFVFAGMFTPGPNVIMLTASGAQFGFRRTLPHLLGVVLGVGVIGGVSGLGIGALLAAYPQLEFSLRIVAAMWILWMAWRLWVSTFGPELGQRKTPFTFVKAILFQWVNPKIWVVALTASSGYNADLTPFGEAFRLATTFSSINLFVCLSVLDIDRHIVGLFVNAPQRLAHLYTRDGAGAGRYSRYGVHLITTGGDT